MAPVIRGNSLYTIVSGPSWADSESNAVAKGGHLATVENEAEDRWLFATFIREAPTANYADSLWIGLNDAETEGVFKWSSGAPVTYINLEAGNNAEHQDWIQYWGKSGVWDTLDFLGWPWGSGRNGIAEIPLTSSITFSSTPKEGAGIFTTSINLSAGTASSGNLAEGATVYWKVSGITADDLASGQLSGSGTITNGKLDLQHSLKADADTGEKFELSAFSDAGMTQQVGTQMSEAILESSNTSTAAARKIVARGNSLYTIVDGPTWTEAESNAAKLGGHLTTINDSSENQLVYSQFKDQGVQEYWIGYNDANTEGQWIWTSGETPTYQNWWNNGPQNPQSLENGIRDFAAIYTNNPTSGTGGTWGYTSNANGNITRGIAEIPFIRRGDSAYVIVQGPTWEEAEANAVKLGGHLVTINDTAENDWIYQKLGVGKWIGLSDKETEGVFKWASGETFSFANWSQGEPSNSGNVQDYVWMQYVPGLWDDLQNDPNVNLGIAEIKLAPNNNPTGTPTLSGNLKAGQIITIDKTPIQDADNFSGYTPEFKYSWEVSSNGTTWTKLTSNDATDNNTTFTLTTAEVGKQVRGVVSYLDGYGTQESVNTAASSVVLTQTPTLQTTTASNNQLILTFSDAIQVTGGTFNPAYLTVTVDGQTRKIIASEISASTAGRNQLTLTLSGFSLLATTKHSISYNPPADTNSPGIIKGVNGGNVAPFAVNKIENYSSDRSISTSGISGAYTNLILSGSEPNAGYGNSLNNRLTGNDGNNILDGLSGADTLIGGKGDDTYVVDNAEDIIIEVAGEGTDTVRSSITYVLGVTLENLTLLGNTAINGTGNSTNNIITGNDGANILNGNGGTDTLIGGKGNDTYIVDSADDTIVEAASVTEIDTVQSSISWSLGFSLENLTLTGTSAINGTGNERNNTIIGNGANNILDGGSDGTDLLTGLGGADTFRFSTRPTSFRNTTADHITDFSSAQGDKIQISKSAFGITASTATLNVVSSDAALNTALSGSALFVYNTSNGELHWNENGITRGAGSGGILAILDNKATLSAGDLILV